MIDETDLFIIGDGICDYCGTTYLMTANEFDNGYEVEEFGQCRDCNIADWKYGGPWHERYDEIL